MPASATPMAAATCTCRAPQTCLSVGGYLQFDVWVYDSDLVQNYFNIAKYLSGATTDPSNPLSDVTGVVAGYLYETDELRRAVDLLGGDQGRLRRQDREATSA